MLKALFLKILKFGVVGISGIAVDFGITYLLKEKLGIQKYVSNSIGFISAASSNYYLNRIWTFKSQNPEIPNINNLTIEQIQTKLEKSTSGLSYSIKREVITIKNRSFLKATVDIVGKDIIVSVKEPLPVLGFMAIGAIAGVLYGGIIWGFGATLALGFLSYYLFFRKPMQDFSLMIINALNKKMH